MTNPAPARDGLVEVICHSSKCTPDGTPCRHRSCDWIAADVRAWMRERMEECVSWADREGEGERLYRHILTVLGLADPKAGA